MVLHRELRVGEEFLAAVFFCAAELVQLPEGFWERAVLVIFDCDQFGVVGG
jgi:hypothetical protein